MISTLRRNSTTVKLTREDRRGGAQRRASAAELRRRDLLRAQGQLRPPSLNSSLLTLFASAQAVLGRGLNEGGNLERERTRLRLASQPSCRSLASTLCCSLLAQAQCQPQGASVRTPPTAHPDPQLTPLFADKSTTKFVPKRKTGVPSSQRASSTTPSISGGTPRVAAHAGGLPQIDEFSLGSRGEEEENRVIHEEPIEAFAVPPPRPPKAVPPASSFGFGPSDPSLVFSSQPASTAGPSFGSSFGPSDPSLTARPPSSSAPPSPKRAKSPSKGTAFSVSTGPPVRSSSPIASTSNAVASSSKGRAQAERGGPAEPRTQREIEEEAKAEAVEKQRKKELAKKKREEAKAAKTAKAAAGEGEEHAEKGKGKSRATPKPRAEGKGKVRAVEGDEVDADGDSAMAPPPKPKRKRAPPKPKVVVTGSGSDEDDTPALKRFKHNVGRKKATKTDLEVFGSQSPSGSEAGSDDDEERGSDESTPPVRKKKVKLTKKEITRVIVDAETTTMFELANPRDVIGGRVSERFVVLQGRAQQQKQARKEARMRMKERAARRARGEETESEEEEAGVEKAETVAGSERGTPAPRKGSPALLDAVAMAIGRGDLENSQGEEADKEKQAKDDDDEEDSDDVGELVETQYAPQMRIVDGKLVIDDASLEVDRSLDVCPVPLLRSSGS